MQVVLPLAVIFFFLMRKKDTAKKVVTSNGKAQKGFFDFMNTATSFDYFSDEISGINDEYDHLFIKYGNKYGVPPRILKGIAANESYIGKYKGTDTVNGLSTHGIMHIQVPTANDYEKGTTAQDLLNPETDIRIGAKHMKFLIDYYDGDIETAVKAYNGGVGNINNVLRGKDFRTKHLVVKNTGEYWNRFNRHIEKMG